MASIDVVLLLLLSLLFGLVSLNSERGVGAILVMRARFSDDREHLHVVRDRQKIDGPNLLVL
jgi:hypothetical protein